MKQNLMKSRYTPSNPRRSSRLNITKDIKNTVIVEISEPPRLKRRKIVKSESEESQSYLPEPTVMSCEPSSSKRRGSSVSVSSKAMSIREKELLKRELELKRKSNKLEEKLSSVARKEQEASVLMEQYELRTANNMLEQLDEHFMCALCCEVMACPYTLNAGRCGHTFCAICILRWYFSRLHRACGGWHESVDCPICRSMLVITPDRLPRPDATFPFVPNRTADAVVQALVEKLALSASSCAGTNKEAKGGSIDGKDNSLIGWKVAGEVRSDWQKRDSEGREEMQNLINRWQTLRAHDFIDIKTRLHV